MRVAVFGLGYVGSVTAAGLARFGHMAYGVDVSREKVRLVNEGRSPVAERGLERLIGRAVRRGNLRATLSAAEAVERSNVSLVCVGTPSRRDGSVNLDFVRRAVGEIGRALRKSHRFHTVAVRSTVLPGTTEREVIPELERSSRKKAGRDFDVCFLPEFLREGSSVRDFLHPAKVLVGRHGARGLARVLELWRPIRALKFVTSLKVAEMSKYVDNAFHALKVAFANEVGAVAKSLGIDSHELMEIFVQDWKLNISPIYLRPGFAFGGPCLPKDLRALEWMGRKKEVKVPLFSGVLASNAAHLRRAVELALETGKKRVGVIGLTFKADTDDLRESPACELVRRLVKAGRKVRVYEPCLDLSRLVGANRAYVESHIPELPSLLLPSLREVVETSEVIVVAGAHSEFRGPLRNLKRSQTLIDMVHLPPSAIPRRSNYIGICW